MPRLGIILMVSVAGNNELTCNKNTISEFLDWHGVWFCISWRGLAQAPSILLLSLFLSVSHFYSVFQNVCATEKGHLQRTMTMITLRIMMWASTLMKDNSLWCQACALHSLQPCQQFSGSWRDIYDLPLLCGAQRKPQKDEIREFKILSCWILNTALI